MSVSAIAAGGPSSAQPMTTSSTVGGLSSGVATAGKHPRTGSALTEALLDTLFALVFDS